MYRQYLIKMCIFILAFCLCFSGMLTFAYKMNAAGTATSSNISEKDLQTEKQVNGASHEVSVNQVTGASEKIVTNPSVNEIASVSTTPESTTPETITPESTTPESTTSESTTPESTTPESTMPEPTTPESTTPEPTTQEPTTPEITKQPEEPIEGLTGSENTGYAGKVVVNVTKYLNIRKKPDADSKVVGKLYNSSGADVVEVGKEWTKITSGSVTGWVSNDYIVTGEKAVELVDELSVKTATVNAKWLRVREKPDTTSTVIADVKSGETFIVAEESKKWVQIIFTSELYGFLSKDYVTVKNTLGTAVSIKEEKKLKLLARQKAETTAAEVERARQNESASKSTINNSKDKKTNTTKSSTSKPSKSTRAETNVNYDEEYMLAALCQMEAGGYDYDACLAVANVVINRKNKGYGSSLKDVIYAKGQFPGAGSGLLQKFLNSGPSKTAKEAAGDALAGINNVGSYVNFCAKSQADTSSYSQYVYIGDNCFYTK